MEFEPASVPRSASVMALALAMATELKWQSRWQLASSLQSANWLETRSAMRLGSRSALRFESAFPSDRMSKMRSASGTNWLLKSRLASALN